MPRKKQQIMAFESLQPDTLHPNRMIVRNFISSKDTVRRYLEEEDRDGLSSMEPRIGEDFDKLLSFKTELRGGAGNIGSDDVFLEEVKLDPSVKPTTDFIWKVFDYGGSNRLLTYTCPKKAVDYVKRKIKTKIVEICYDGIKERCEFTPEKLEEIMSKVQDETIDISIIPIGRGGVENEMILMVPFKNHLK